MPTSLLTYCVRSRWFMHLRLSPTLLTLAIVVLFAVKPISAYSQQHALIAKHVPDLVTSGQSSVVGRVDSTHVLQLAISLPLRNESELKSLIREIYDPKSPNYHHYLNATEFTQRFGPSEGDYNKVIAWSRAKGLHVRGTPSNRRLIDVEGSVDTINQAFGVTLTNYLDSAKSRVFFAPDREPIVDLRVQLLSVSGLDNAYPPATSLKRDRRVSHDPEELQSLATLGTGSGPGASYTPSDMRAAYYGSGTLTGTGQTVAIFRWMAI